MLHAIRRPGSFRSVLDASTTRLASAFASLLVLSVLGGGVTPASATEAEPSGTDRFSALLLDSAAEQGAALAIRWTGDPSARLSAWVDLDGRDDGAGEIQVLDGALLDEGMKLFAVQLPPGSEAVRTDIPMRFRLSRQGQMPRVWRESVERMGQSGPLIGEAGVAESMGACEWSDGFHVQGLSNTVRASAVFDDGTGPALYVGGRFATVGSIVLGYIGKWDGARWSALGSGVDDSVEALLVYDGESGPVLVAGGEFKTAGGAPANRVAQWDGTGWSALGSGMSSGVSALAVYDDGSDPVLVAGGRFHQAGGVPANYIAQWDGTHWSALGSGMDNTVEALAVYEADGGPMLVAGGRFTMAGGVAVSFVAGWDGTRWSALGSGTDDAVLALAEYRVDDAPILVAGGEFTTAGGVLANHVASWDGSTWSPLGSGMSTGGGSLVSALTVHDDGSGLVLVVGGRFTSAGGVAANEIAQWDGSTWSAFDSGLDLASVATLTAYDLGSGPMLAAGGTLGWPGGFAANRLALWDGSDWISPDPGSPGDGLDGWSAGALTVYDPGGGPVLVAGGSFTRAGGRSVGHIAQWNGVTWSPLGSGMNHGVDALAVYDAGNGPVLVAGGQFTTAGGISAPGVAQWDGTSWSPLGSGLVGLVRDLVVYDDGSGPILVAGGRFEIVGGDLARIAQWDGMSWSPIGADIDSDVHALAVYERDGSSVLVAGGSFTTVEGTPASRIAQWDGVSWSALGSGVDDTVQALMSYGTEEGPSLVAGGMFSMAGGEPARGIAQWDGMSWSPLGRGIDGVVTALTTYDDGTGPSLVAGGWFATAGEISASNVARWDGTRWSTFGSDMATRAWVAALTVYDPGVGGPQLVASGPFEVAGGRASSRIAVYGCPSVSLTLTNSVDEVVAGGTVTYSLRIENDGRVDVASVPLTVELPDPLGQCRWQSSGTHGAAGHTSGVGDTLDQRLDLPAGSSVRYVVSCAVPATAEGALRLDASVSIPGSPNAATVAADEDPIVDRHNVSTLILTHPGRMLEQMDASAADLEALAARLHDFAAHPSVDGLLIDVGYHAEIAELYELWDADVADGFSDPGTANRVLFGCASALQCGTERDGLHDLVRSVLHSRADIEFLMLVGDDRIFPMARVPDFTDYPREIDYTTSPLGNFTPDLSHVRTTVGQALARNRYLSDDPIGVRGPMSVEELELPFLRLRPDLATGRLVETPSEMRRSLDVFLERDGRIDLTRLDTDRRVLVSGYDFLEDSAALIRQRWQQAFDLPNDYEGRVPLDGELIGRTWGLATADQREAALLDHWSGSGEGAYALMSLNGHASHYEEGVPGENVHDIQGLSTAEIATLAPELAGEGSLIYAVGCHGGLPVPGSDSMDGDRSLDLPQTLLAQGALGYLANSGFGWGLLYSVGYSEKMVTLFTEELTQPGTITLGQAVLRTKHRYFTGDISFDLRDIKTSLQWTLFGFPMVKIVTGIREGAGQVDHGPGQPVSGGESDEAECARRDLPEHLECKAVVNGMSDHGSFVKYRASGEVVPAGVVGCPDPADDEHPEGCYYALNGLTTTEAGWPIEPVLIEDSSRTGTSQHGVLWTGGRYRQESGWVPVLARPVSSGGPAEVAGSLPKTTFIRPRGRVSGGPLGDGSHCSSTDAELNTLVFVPAELIHDEALEPTTHRLHEVVSLEIFYFDNDADGAGNCDRLGPAIGSGPFHRLDGNTVRFSMTATDGYSEGEEKEGVWRVVVVWDNEPESRWEPLDLDYDAGSESWTGELIRPAGMEQVVYFVQAVDRRGNVSWVNYQAPGASVRVDASELGESGLPLPIEVGFSPSSIFEDGFDLGNLDAWSLATD